MSKNTDNIILKVPFAKIKTDSSVPYNKTLFAFYGSLGFILALLLFGAMFNLTVDIHVCKNVGGSCCCCLTLLAVVREERPQVINILLSISPALFSIRIFF